MKKHLLLYILFTLYLTYSQSGFAQNAIPLGNHKDFVSQFKSQNSLFGKSKIYVKISATNSLPVVINVRKQSGDADIFIGQIDKENSSTFFLAATSSEIEGNIVLTDKKIAYQYYSDSSGNPFVKQVDIHSVLCIDYNKSNAAVDTNGVQYAPAAGSTAYTLQSLPGATAVALLDFDGQYVSGTRWNSGNPINASASNFSEAQITEMWRMISEDYRPFNINITTDSTVFFAAPANRRQRCIFTPTNTAAPGSGGVAYLNSFSSGNDNDTPCWVFNSGVKSAGEAGSHELGHTFGLSHDGTSTEDYYQGQGYWAPIMGAAYYDILTQWSMGEYPDANNHEDDVAIITKTANGVAYRADEAGNTIATAKVMTIAATGTIDATKNYGIITTRTDIDVYSFSTSGGTVNITVSPSSLHPDLNVLLNLTDASGTVLMTANPTPSSTTNAARTASLAATISSTLAAGTYYLYIDGTGEGDLTTGYSDYACIGEYSISGTIPVTGGSIPPVVSMTAPANNATFCSGTSIALTATASDADGTISKVEFYDGTNLIATITSSPYTYSWTTATSGTHNITAKATDNGNLGTTSLGVNITVNATPAPPTVTSAVSYCLNATASTLTATGTSLKWYTTDIGGSASTTAPKPVTTSVGSINYYVSQTSNNCESNRSTITVTVNALPSAPIVTSPVIYCQNAIATAITADGASLKWYTASTGGTSSSTAPIPSTATVGTTNRYVSQTVNGCESARATIVITINASPSAPTVTTPVIYCQNAISSPLTATGTNLQWYNGSSGGPGTILAPTPQTSSIGSTNFYVSQSSNGCESSRSLITVTVNPLPVAPSAPTPVNYCQNATASALTASGTSLKWYTASSGGSGNTTAPVPVTSTTGTYIYYVSQTINSCESPRANIIVNINASPASPTVVSPVNYCLNASASPLIATGTSLKWYSALTGGTGSTTAPTPSTTTSGTTNFYVSQTANACESPRALIAVTVNPAPSVPTVVSPVSYCQNATASALSASGTSLKWYTSSSGGIGSANAPVPVTSSAGTTNYYVSQTIGACESNKALIAVTVNALPIANISPGGPTSFCLGGSVILTASSGTSYIWYNGIVQVGTNSTYSTTASGNYTVEVSNDAGCKVTSTPILVTVNPVPQSSITASGPLTFTEGGSVLLSATSGSGFTYRWFNGTLEVGNNSTYLATTSGNYSVEITNSLGCKGTSTITIVTVLSNQPPSVQITSPAFSTTFTSPANVSLTATATDADGSITKVAFYNRNSLIGTDPTSPYNFAFNNLPTGTYSVTAVATDNLGAESTSLPVVFSVINVLPNVTITSPLDDAGFIESATVTINAIASDANGVITSVEFYSGNTLIGADGASPYTITWNNVNAGNYVIIAKAIDNEGGFTISQEVSIAVSANQPSVITITSPLDSSIFTGTSVNINATVNDPDGEIVLVEFLDGNTVIGSTTHEPYNLIIEHPSVGSHLITVRVTDSNGGVTISSPTTFIVNSPSGLYSFSGLEEYCRIYPNPSNSIVHIETSIDLENVNIKFLNDLGIQVWVPFNTSDTDIKADFSSLASGVYTMLLTQVNLIIRKKIVIVR